MKDRKAVAVAALLYFAVLLYFSHASIENYAPIKSDFLINDYFSDLLVKNHTLLHQEPLNKEYAQIFAPTSFVANPDGTVTHSSFHGFILLLALVKAISPSLVFVLIPLLFMIALLFFYKLNKLLFGEEKAVLATVMLALFSPFLYWATAPLMNTIAAFSFYVASLYFFFKALDESTYSNYCLGFLLAGMAIWCNYFYAVLYLPLALVLFRKVDLKKALASSLVFIALIGTLLALNTVLYGGPFNSLSELSPNVIKFSLKERVSQYLEAQGISSTEFALQNFLKFVVRIDVVIFAVLLLGGVYFLKKYHGQEGHSRDYIVYLSLIFIIQAALFSSMVFYGTDTKISDINVNASYVRYLFTGYLLPLTLFAAFATKLLSDKRILFFLIAAFAVTNVLVAASEIQNLQEKQASFSKSNYYAPNVKLPPNAVVFTKNFDIHLFPKYAVAKYDALPEEGRISRTVSIIKSILHRNDGKYAVFFADDGSTKAYFDALSKNGIQAKRYYRSFYELKLKG